MLDPARAARGPPPSSDLRKTRVLLLCNVFLLSVFGFILFVTSVYTIANLSRRSFFTWVATNLSYLGLIASMFCFIAAICAGCAMRRQSRVLFGCTILFSGVFLIMLIWSAVAMQNFAYSLQVGSPGLPSGSLVALQDIFVNNMALSIFVKCCSGCPLGCTNPRQGAYSNTTLPFCAPPANLCTQPGACANTTQANCFLPMPTPSGATRPGFNFTIPTSYVDDYVCSSLQSMTLNGVALVGQASVGSCGGGDPTAFLNSLSAYLKSWSSGVIGVYIFVAVVQSVLIAASIYMACVSLKSSVAANTSSFKEDDSTGGALERI